MHLIIMIAIDILQCCTPFYAIGRREGSLILSTKSQVSSHSLGPSSSSWSLRRQSSRLFWMLSWFKSFPMNTNSCRRSPQGHAWSLGVWYVHNMHCTALHILTTSILGYLPLHFLGTMPSESLAHLATLAKGVCAERIEDCCKSEGSSYLNSQSHGLYGLILMIFPACRTTWIVWLLASIIEKI